jgi:ZIP family zinc transporter
MLGLPIFVLAVLASVVAGLATGLGALPVFALRRMSAPLKAVLLGFGAGVMLAASAFSLLLPALQEAGRLMPGLPAALAVAAGVLLGSGLFAVANRWVPHEHFIKGREGASAERIARIWLFVLAITLHNFPEGLAVGVGFGTDRIANGFALTLGIALQNMPEGLVVAVALRGVGKSSAYAFWVALLTGLVEPLGAVAGAGAVALAAPLLPGALAMAAGAMLYVISDEIIPESHRGPAAALATQGVLVGFVLMMVLDVALG